MGALSWEMQIGQILYNSGQKKKNDELFDGMSLDEMLIYEANRLKDIIQKYIDLYYANNTPKFYHRNNNFKKSLRVETNVVDKSIAVYFDDDLAWEPSLKTGGDPYGFIPILVDTGWAWHNGQKTPYHFAYYEGDKYLQNAIKEFTKTDKYNVGIHIEINPHAEPEFSSAFVLSQYARDVYDNM